MLKIKKLNNEKKTKMRSLTELRERGKDEERNYVNAHH